MTLVDRVRSLGRSGALDLPPIGAGRTADRWLALAALARHDVSEARIAEAHVDALQILAEAGRPPTPGALYGVWASEHPRWHVTGTDAPEGALALHGSKAFCTGAGLLDRALVSVAVPGPSGDGTRLVELDLATVDPARVDASSWVAAALSDTETAVVDLDGLVVPADATVGADGWYLDRPGFWDGAIGPAACWAGAALGLVDHAAAHPPSDPHGRAHLGALAALGWSLEAALEQAGREIDAATGSTADPGERARAARRRALVVRHLVDVTAAEIQDRFARALGPRPLVADGTVIERDQALSLYRRQCHAERDLETLGTLLDPRASAGDGA